MADVEVGATCPHCKKAKLIFMEENFPYTQDHLMCEGCYSTYNLPKGHHCSNCGKFFSEQEMIETQGKIPHDCGRGADETIRIEDGRRK